MDKPKVFKKNMKIKKLYVSYYPKFQFDVFGIFEVT